jgi:hypothetical protein
MPRRLKRSSSFLAAKDHASTHSPCCASAHVIPQQHQLFARRVSLRSMLSCLLLWLRHSSRQLLWPSARFVHTSFITLHYVSFALPTHWFITFGLCYIALIFHGTTSNYIHITRSSLHYILFHSVLFTQPASGHPLPLLCSPALSFGLRAVMLFAPSTC